MMNIMIAMFALQMKYCLMRQQPVRGIEYTDRIHQFAKIVPFGTNVQIARIQ
ncbi:transposase [Brevibacillus laterosporus GI-9]|nr:transposase [Brevibacillus laterosporus GI-9]